MARDPRRVVKMLTEWLEQRERQDICNLTDPENFFMPWVNRVVSRYYYKDVLEFFGMDKQDFAHECAIRLLRKIAERPAWFISPDCTDGKIGKYLMTIAERCVRDYGRKMRPERCCIVNGSSGEDERGVPEESLRQDIYDLPDENAAFIENRQQAGKVGSAFLKTLEKEPKLVATYWALLHYPNKAGIPELFESGHWFVLQLLTRPAGEHVPKDVQECLRDTFPDDKYNVVSQRLTLLKQKLSNFRNTDDVRK